MALKNAIRLGIIGSSGGSALASASQCLKLAGREIEWVVVTDRKCGLEDWATSNSYSANRVQYIDSKQFSEKAFQIFKDEGCEDVLLFFTRRVASPLINLVRVWNIHPALLPSFRGLRGVKDALETGVKIIGATLHRVDEGLDTGPIVSQVASPLPAKICLAEAEHISYLQKVWLTLAWFEHAIGSCQPTNHGHYNPPLFIASPGLSDHRLYKIFIEFLVEDEALNL